MEHLAADHDAGRHAGFFFQYLHYGSCRQCVGSHADHAVVGFYPACKSCPAGCGIRYLAVGGISLGKADVVSPFEIVVAFYGAYLGKPHPVAYYEYYVFYLSAVVVFLACGAIASE